MIVTRKKPARYYTISPDINRAGFRIPDAWAKANTVIDPSRLINSSTEAARPSVARVLYFRAIYSCGQAVMIDSSSALGRCSMRVLNAVTALASPEFASMGEVGQIDSRIEAQIDRRGRGPGPESRVQQYPGPIEQASGLLSAAIELGRPASRRSDVQQHQ